MTRRLLLLLSMVMAMGAPSVVFAWDGIVAGKIFVTEVTAGTNYGFRITLEGAPILCNGGVAWAYLNDVDSNYRTYVAVLLLAKAQNATVTVYSSLQDGACHMGHIAAG